jgi:hypothetical protein
MTLPASGALSFSAINTELGRASTATLELKTASDSAYVVINRNSTAGYNIWYNSVVNGNNYSIDKFYGYNHSANILFDYSFSNNCAVTVSNIVISFGSGNTIVNRPTLTSGQELNGANINTNRSGNGWYVYYSNNIAAGYLVDIYLYDADTGDELYSIYGDTANTHTGQSIGPTSNYYRHLGLNLTFNDP